MIVDELRRPLLLFADGVTQTDGVWGEKEQREMGEQRKTHQPAEDKISRTVREEEAVEERD